MAYLRDLLYGDVAQIQHASFEMFGSGRLIGRNLVLTARHVVTSETTGVPIEQGWQVRLYANSPKLQTTDKWAWVRAKVSWVGPESLDLALVELCPQAGNPNQYPKLKMRIGQVDEARFHRVLGIGFPRGAKVDNKRALVVAPGSIYDQAGKTLSFGIDQSAQPKDPTEDWRGFSGSAVLLEANSDPALVWIYGVVQQVPPRFTHQFAIARLAEAWADERFRKALDAAGVDLNLPADPIAHQQTIRRPFTVPTVPQGVVPRSDITHALVAALLNDDKEPLAIHGSGGFGKTTLAITVCNKPEVVRAFPDGVVWVTLGEKDPRVEQKLAEIYAVFSGEQPAETTIVGIAANLREKLSNKRCLIVIDDVWNDVDLAPFEGIGAHRLLFTTRKRELLGERAKVEVNEMTLDESFQLLVRGIPEAVRHQNALESFAAQFGGWALLLELANARLLTESRAQQSFERALAYVTKLYRGRGVIGFDRKDTKERNKAVATCLDVGLEAYKETIPTLRVRASELGIFPEHVSVPDVVLCQLWSCDEFSLGEDTLRYLHDLSIIKWDRQARVVRMHDSVRAALATWVPNRQESHRRLLDAWRNQAQFSHDYAWRWYGWHCLEAGEPQRLHKLLLTPSWLQAKLEHTDVSALVADCERLASAEPTAAHEKESPQFTAPSMPDSTFSLIGDALKKSAHILAYDKGQLRDQLFGRLRTGMSSELDILSRDLRSQPGRQNLRARFANLEPAGSPLVRTLTGHEHGVDGALLLTDGKHVLSWSHGGRLRLWNLETGQQIGSPFSGSKDGVDGALLLGEKIALSWSSDKTLLLWDLETRKQTGHVFVGHEDRVNGALRLPGGKQALSWSDDKTLRLWDLKTAQQVGAPLTGHEDGVNGALHLPGGKQVLSWSNDKTLRLWDLRTSQQLGAPLTGHQGWVDGALLLPGGKQALSWSRDRTLRLWDLETAQQINEPFTGHEDGGIGALLLPGGKQALSWSNDRTLRVWDLNTGQQTSEPFSGHVDGGLGALLLPGRKKVLSWSSDRTLRVWDLKTGQQAAKPLIGHESEVQGALFLPRGKQALSWSWDGTLRLWNLERRQYANKPFTGHEKDVVGTLLLPNRKQALSWSWDGTLRLWDMERGQQVGEPLTGHKKEVVGALLLPDGKLALSWSWDGTLRLWDLETRKQFGEPLTGHDNGGLGALLLPDGKHALSWSSDRTLRLWNLETSQQASGPLIGHDDNILGALLVLDGKQALSWSSDRTLRLWNLEIGQQAGTPLIGHQDSILGALLLPDGRQVLSWSSDRSLRLWDLENCHRTSTPLTGHDDSVLGACLLPGGRQALSWSSDRTLRLWDLEKGALIGSPITGHEDSVLGACLLPGERKALSWSSDRTLRLWELETGALIGRPITGHEDWVDNALVLPHGKQALSWSSDRTLRLWDLTKFCEIARFHSEGIISTLVECEMNKFLAGDGTGRVYFLELMESLNP